MADYVLFIDTNILLDFYRASSDAGLDLLAKIDQLHDRIVTTDQVEMEFKKNRQRVIVTALEGLRKPENKCTVPVFFRETKAVHAMDRSLKRAAALISALKERTKKILAHPTVHDPVYNPIERLFRAETSLSLSRSKDIRFKIRRLAWKRFILGYPPRKDRDTSIGDAINWEWIIECARKEGKNVIVASRDSDYGVAVGDTAYINDWLLQEFRDRVSKKNHVILTGRLSDALKQMAVTVSKQEEEEEARIVERSKEASGARLVFEKEISEREVSAHAYVAGGLWVQAC
ncbi:MAG: PIN domain-containing protein [Planctomycetota bacterium]|nr:PIN domain-containing protein [Planctomycetota bacterium]